MTKPAQKQNPAKGISRYDNDRKRMHGWQARVQWEGQAAYKRFSDKSHGGPEEALAAAIEWRDETEHAFGKPRTERWIRSSQKGVHLEVDGHGKESFAATWSPKPGVTEKTRFSVSKYGRREAKRRAQELRRKMARRYLLLS